MTPTIESARFPEQTEEVREILREYAGSIGVELCFQSFEEELAGLPGKYAPPRGRCLVAAIQGRIAGVVALRALEGEVCEMKRLFVRPSHRNAGLGRRLAEAIIEQARVCGYAAMRLDTLDELVAAQKLYLALGFRDIPPYYPNPVPGVRYLELRL